MFAKRIFHKKWNKSDKIDPTPLQRINGLVQHITVGEPNSIQGVKVGRDKVKRNIFFRLVDNT